MRVGLLFPGQGYQRLGVFASLSGNKKLCSIVKPVLDEADEALPHLKLSELLLTESARVDVNSTEIAQPFMLAASYAYFRVFNSTSALSGDVNVALGHSLGEYTAHVAAGHIDFASALKLVHERGMAMKHASIHVGEPTGMLVTQRPRRGWEVAQFHTFIQDLAVKQDVDIAAYNSQDVFVLSGTVRALEELKPKLKPAVGTLLPVSGAFHSRYMEPALPRLRELVDKASWNWPGKFGVISNVTATSYESIDEIKQRLVEALIKPVLWRSSVHEAASDVDEMVSLGPGSIGKLTAREILPKATLNIQLD